MMVNYQRLSRSSVFTAVLFALTVQACRSSEENHAQGESVPALHHAPDTSSPAAPGEARLMDGMGHVDFAITTNSKEAQAFFNQGVAQLYGFWFEKAEDSFAQAAKLDPRAAMAYWGI